MGRCTRRPTTAPDCRWHPPTTSRFPERETIRRGAASSGRRSGGASPTDTRTTRASRCCTRPTGLYFLMEGTDRTLTATMNEDFMDLWKEDVFEVFLWTDERFPVYFEYRDLAARSRAADPHPQFRRTVPGLAALALRPGSQDAESHQHHRRPETVAGSHSGMARRVLHSVRPAVAAAERPSEAGQCLARQLLPDGPRRGQDDAVGVGAGRRQFPRVPEVRPSGVRGSMNDHVFQGGQ